MMVDNGMTSAPRDSQGEENDPGLSISDIREAVAKTLPRGQWLSLEGDEKEPIPSLSSLLNTTWDYLQTQLGKASCVKRAIYNRLGNPDITIIRPNRSENIRNGLTYFSLGAKPPVRLAEQERRNHNRGF